MRLYKILTASAVLAVAAAGTGQADSLESVVVTATRTAEPIAATGDSVSVITDATLAAHQVTALSDALAQTPGTVVTRAGGLGQTTTLSLRGAEAGQSLVLIDGVRLNDPSTVDGQAVLGDLMVGDVSRIEVLRGPQSALYGSSAIGGVVDIITRRGGGQPFSARAEAEAGSFATYKLGAGANGTLGSFEYGAAANYLHSSGISAADARLGNSEPDGTTNLGGTLNTRYTLLPGLSIDLRAYAVRTRTDFDDKYAPPSYALSDSPVYQRDTLYAGYAGVNFALFGGALRNRVSFSQTLSRRTTYDSPYYLPLTEDYAYRGSARRFEYQGILDLGNERLLTFGAETERTELASQIAGFADAAGHQRTTGYYAEGLAKFFGALTLTAGLRLEDNDGFGTHMAYKASAAYALDADTVLRAAFGTGFKAPSLYERFSTYSNPVARLAPESATGWEAGIDRRLWGDRVVAQITWFDRRTRDLIDFYSCYGGGPGCAARPYGYYYNVGRSKANGVEAGLALRVNDALTARLDYTDLIATDEITHTELPRRPRNTLSASAEWRPIAGWSAGAQLLYVGRRFDGAYDSSPLPGHVTVDLFAGHKVSEAVELYARVENLFDARYEPAAGYGAPGRAVYGGVRWSD